MILNKKFRDVVLSKVVKPGEHSVGIEVESIIFTNNGKRLPVHSKKELSSAKIIQILKENNGKSGEFSLEPGGQIEWSSNPYRNLNDLENAIKVQNKIFYKVLNKNNLKIIPYGVDPFYSPENLDLIKQKKYQLMDKHMERSGTMGKWMMRCTSSIQVNFDFTSLKEMEEMVFIADALHPVASFIFSNSPLKNGKKTGKKNIRHLIWGNTDNFRCNNLIDHDISSPIGLMDNYIRFLYKVPGIFQLDREKKIERTTKTLGGRVSSLLKNGELKDYDIQAALHQIFTNVRIKNLVEVRGSDRTPIDFEIAPAAFWTGILLDQKIRIRIIKILKNWTLEDRKIFNKCAKILDFNQLGPQNKSFREWISIIGKISMEGLEKRNLNEVHLFKNFFDIVMEKGPFGLQNQ